MRGITPKKRQKFNAIRTKYRYALIISKKKLNSKKKEGENERQKQGENEKKQKKIEATR